ncbi:uncharacterized protein VTP21DRAFT_1441 [Calcarisporiella thermophila]|uniref:uncharacterized protein n=1 Tax=Calcarisporiella thermophila TaxID=911321 RepID=UPI00374294DF
MTNPSERLDLITSHLSGSTAGVSVFQNTPTAPPDAIFHLTARYKSDPFPDKVNLGIGAYRTEEGKPWILPVVKKADAILFHDDNLDHEYLGILGLPGFREAASKLMLGADSPAIREKRVVAVQSLSGTGSLHLGALFLAQFYKKGAIVYISKPTWGNHRSVFENQGLQVKDYAYYNAATVSLDYDGMIRSLREAPQGSIIVLHPCAHNPTGIDPTQDQWRGIADVMAERNHFPFFDCAYQGFASGDLDRDAWAVRYFVSRGFEMFIAQSFAKNMGLYGERAGCFSVVSKTPEIAVAVESQLSRLQRAVISNPPAYGARIASLVMNDPKLFSEWQDNLKTMANRIHQMRQQLYDELVRLKTPGNWKHIVDQIGMFSFTGLKAPQVKVMIEKYHIYLTDNGRISIAGLSTRNVKYVAKAMDDVVRNIQV